MNRKDFAWEPKAAEPSRAAHECTQTEPTCTPRYGIHPQLGAAGTGGICCCQDQGAHDVQGGEVRSLPV